ncbi:hypothetical protein FRC18_008384 [Serendipita sp. 400]|nr:hypothetical protein FRC18_008384 [Serendipita sp. 400]
MNDQEPPMTDSHPFIRGGILPTKARSVFEVFVEDRRRDKYCCNWAANGQWCRRIFWQRSIAVAHAHIHLNYRPFTCHGKCGNEQCGERFPTRDTLILHAKKRRVMCDICGVYVYPPNLKRHTSAQHRV